MNKQKIIVTKDDSKTWGLTKGRKAIALKVYFRNGEHHVKGSYLDSNEIFDLPYIFFEEEEDTTWNLYDASENPENGETIMFYTDGQRKFSFYSHPTRSFSYVSLDHVGLDRKEISALLDYWIGNAIGEKETYYERIQEFKSSGI